MTAVVKSVAKMIEARMMVVVYLVLVIKGMDVCSGRFKE